MLINYSQSYGMLNPTKKQKGRNHMTFLDLLVIVSGGIITAGVLVMVAMFLLKSEKARRVGLYACAALGLYLGYVGFRINAMSYGSGSVIALVLALGSVAAVVLDRFLDRKYIPQAVAAASLVGGMMNAFL